MKTIFALWGARDLLARRVGRLMTSVAAFGGDRNLDVVPTSRYRLR
ncbi:hypothetical protein [Nocardia sp. Marseille-Q1738]